MGPLIAAGQLTTDQEGQREQQPQQLGCPARGLDQRKAQAGTERPRRSHRHAADLRISRDAAQRSDKSTDDKHPINRRGAIGRG